MEGQIPKALTLVRQRAPKRPGITATISPIARVIVDTGVFHLDQEFDFLVPETFSKTAQPGVSVRVPFNGRKCEGFLVARSNSSAHIGSLQYLDKVNNDQPLLTASTLKLARRVAAKYAGNLLDVLRFAIPAPIGSSKEIEQNFSNLLPIKKQVFDGYPDSYLESIEQGEFSKVIWTPSPGADPYSFLAEICKIRSGNILILVPDAKNLDRCLKLFLDSGIGKNISTWSSEMVKSARYATFLNILNGKSQIIIGVRGAVFLPIGNLSLIVVWDEGNDNYQEIRSPGWNCREVAIERAKIENCALILGSFSPSLMATKYLFNGELKSLRPTREKFKAGTPRFIGISELSAPDQRGRISTKAWKTIQKGLLNGPVLVQVPLRGYISALICKKCANHARCNCGGKLTINSNNKKILCALCGRVNNDWQCLYCGGNLFRHLSIGDERTLEEIGKAFPKVAIHNSHQGSIITEQIADKCIVISTPGCEPRANSGYSAIVFLDSRIFLERASVNAEEKARLNWFSVSALAAKDAEIFLDLVTSEPHFQALLRWDPWHAATTDLLERAQLHLPPDIKAVSVTGPHSDIHTMVLEFSAKYLVSSLQSTDDIYLSKIIIRASAATADELVSEISAYCRLRSAHGLTSFRVRVDPIEL